MKPSNSRRSVAGAIPPRGTRVVSADLVQRVTRPIRSAPPPAQAAASVVSVEKTKGSPNATR